MMGGRQVLNNSEKQPSGNLSDSVSDGACLKSLRTHQKPKQGGPTENLVRGPERPRFGGACSAQTCACSSDSLAGSFRPTLVK